MLCKPRVQTACAQCIVCLSPPCNVPWKTASCPKEFPATAAILVERVCLPSGNQLRYSGLYLHVFASSGVFSCCFFEVLLKIAKVLSGNCHTVSTTGLTRGTTMPALRQTYFNIIPVFIVHSKVNDLVVAESCDVYVLLSHRFAWVLGNLVNCRYLGLTVLPRARLGRDGLSRCACAVPR